MPKKSKSKPDIKWKSIAGLRAGLGLALDGAFGANFGAGLTPGLRKDLQRLNENFPRLPRRVQEVIFILGRVRPVPRSSIRVAQRQKLGETADYLVHALKIVRESTRYLSDSEVARLVGVSPSTLSRNETYQKAKRTYLQPYLTIGKSGLPREPES